MRDYRPHIGRQVVVQLKGDALVGTLAGVGKDALTITDVALVENDRQTPMDGLVVIPHTAVTWVQVV